MQDSRTEMAPGAPWRRATIVDGFVVAVPKSKKADYLMFWGGFKTILEA